MVSLSLDGSEKHDTNPPVPSIIERTLFDPECFQKNFLETPKPLLHCKYMIPPLRFPARPLRSPLSAFRSSSPAFTLTELLITITVIAILAGITLAAMGGVNQKATRDKAKAEIAAISNALEQYKSVNDSYPAAGGNNTVPFGTNGATIRPFYIANKVQTNASGQLEDPWGKAYKYQTPGDNNPASFDVWTTDSKGNTIGNW